MIEMPSPKVYPFAIMFVKSEWIISYLLLTEHQFVGAVWNGYTLLAVFI